MVKYSKRELDEFNARMATVRQLRADGDDDAANSICEGIVTEREAVNNAQRIVDDAAIAGEIENL